MKIPDWFDPETVYKCMHLMIDGERNEMCRSDLQFDEGQFWLVLEWQHTHDGEIPSERIALAADLLQPPSEPGKEWVYQTPVERCR